MPDTPGSFPALSRPGEFPRSAGLLSCFPLSSGFPHFPLVSSFSLTGAGEEDQAGCPPFRAGFPPGPGLLKRHLISGPFPAEGGEM